MGRERETGGEFKSVVSDDDVLSVLSNADTPVLTTQMIADELPVTRQAVYYRLQELHEMGSVGRMKVGARAVVWWVADESE
ncbi:HTH domain-containing protein [Halobacteria archaeon AArc-m2/3/4]|uniref:HTH domain-containing protein n=1 Tax=Natronoglomus mannanivorans TaxID=2979990 RepID=A0ABT2QBV0_9EURY|nr:HTH domain-containing protein [Halobacteria archaeon AArc-m2/3/4]